MTVQTQDVAPHVSEKRTVNVGLLQKTLAFIERHPEHWDQRDWRQVADNRCGTAMCFAGWAAHLDGGRWISDPDDSLAEYLTPVADDRRRDIITPADHWLELPGSVIGADKRATRILGITEEQAEVLFDEDNSLATLVRLVNALCSDPDADLEEVLDATS